MIKQDSEKFDTLLDTSGLLCPLPVLKLRKFLKTANTGKIVKMIATDPASLKDVADFCNGAGHILQNQCEAQDDAGEDIFIHYVSKGNS